MEMNERGLKMENNIEQKKESEGTRTAAQNLNTGNAPEAIDIVKRASETREGLARENERLEKNLAELRELTARQILGGQSQAGQIQQKEMTAKEYANMVLSGRLK